jgi:hypothetical protein
MVRTEVRLMRRQVSSNAPAFGQACLPHEQVSRPFGFSETVQGLPSCVTQMGHMAIAPWKGR